MVAASVGFATVAILAQRRASKLGSPDHQRAVEESALLQIFDQRGDRLIDDPGIVSQVSFQIAVLVPGFINYVDEPDSSFHHAPGQQTIASKRQMRVGDIAATGGLRMLSSPDTVRFLRSSRFSAEINQLRSSRLHAKCQFVTGDAAGNFRIAHFLKTILVQRSQSIQAAALLFVAQAGRVGQIQDRLALISKSTPA